MNSLSSPTRLITTSYLTRDRGMVGYTTTCICGTRFTRLDALNRHIATKSTGAPQFLFNYREKGFRRRDHLTQHEDRCPRNCDNNHHLGSTTDSSIEVDGTYNSQWLPLGCYVMGCDRVGPNGFNEQSQLIEHHAVVHSVPTLDASQDHEDG
ncbi:uncharacterized protein F4822DRAFT_273627 [Hypoxylon trugodes]|uniref:uncharacterized protein n=1 Tax=Hypoxylon trugodes TaxID=326681 RepID=UPI0021909F2B|nr:uncharacterized protein F4822DRAFT_273627 [Hypoxylon trugodes]KAI1389244.1 hypothetical protein F4822DRAFT_273627 [Hypoxylon trugodes]